jgi:hypothetical protein
MVECREAAYTCTHRRCGVEITTNQNYFTYLVVSIWAVDLLNHLSRNGKRDEMKNPFGDQQIPGSYENLKERMYKKVLVKVNEQIREIMVRAYENALNEENVVLSRPERKRLLSQIVKMVMEDILKKLDGSSTKKE